MSKSALGGLALVLLTTAALSATPCGTVAAPTACSVTIAGNTTYTFTNFAWISASANGSGTLYDPADVAIDVADGGGLSALLTFSKSTASPGTVFAANAGQASSFIFTYDVTLSAAGAVAYASPFVVGIPQGSQTGTGFGSVKLSVTDVTEVAECQADVGTGDGNCTIPDGQPLTLEAGDTVTLSGLAGSVSIGSFTNRFSATFHTAGRYYTMSPCRVVDTRSAPVGGGAFTHDATRTYGFAACPIPTTAQAVSLNVTAVEASGGGQFNLFSADLSDPSTVVVGFNAGLNRANNAIVGLSALDNEIKARALLPGGGTVQLIIDINGYFE